MNSMIDEQTSKVPEERLIEKFEPYIRALPEDRARFCRELLRRAQGIADRMSAAPVPSDPWLPGPNESAAVRRDAARLRAGIILPKDPTVDPVAFACVLESRVEYRKLLLEVMRELADACELISKETGRMQDKLVDDAVATLHSAKHLPSAKDPNSNLSHHIRLMNRARRSDQGRPRKPKRR